MKLSEAREKGFKLRDVQEGEFYTKDIYKVTKLEDDHSVVELDMLGIVPEDELYVDIDPDKIEDGVYDRDNYFIHKNLPSSFPGVPLAFFDTAFDNDLYNERLNENLDIELNENGDITKASIKPINEVMEKSEFKIENEYYENNNLKQCTYTSNGYTNNAKTIKTFDENGILDSIHFEDDNIIKHYDTIKCNEYNKNTIHIKGHIDEIKNQVYSIPSLQNTKNIDVLYDDSNFSNPELYIRYDENDEIDGMISVEYTNDGPLQEARIMQSIQVQNDDYDNYWDSGYGKIDIF